MSSPERLSDYLFPRPREQARPAPVARAPYGRSWFEPGNDSFWHRHLRPPSALVLSLAVSLMAAVIAFVATIIYANVDAGRSLEAEPTPPTAVPAQGNDDEEVPPGEGDATTATTTPEVLTDDLLAERLSASVWSVSTLSPSGEPVEGSAFVAGSFGGRALLLTSLAVVDAATAEPAPPITISQGSRTTDVTLWTWQESSDLALLVTNVGSPSLPLGIGADLERNDRLYTMAAGRTLTRGIVTAVGSDGLDHNIFVEPALAGAPILNQRGEVVAVASAAYNPGGRATTTTFIGIPVSRACERVLDCGGGNVDPDNSPSTTVEASD